MNDMHVKYKMQSIKCVQYELI